LLAGLVPHTVPRHNRPGRLLKLQLYWFKTLHFCLAIKFHLSYTQTLKLYTDQDELIVPLKEQWLSTLFSPYEEPGPENSAWLDERLVIWIFYCWQAAYHLWSTKTGWHKDSPDLKLHHFITFVLIGFSMGLGQTRLGLLAFLCTDSTDATLYFARFCHVAEEKTLAMLSLTATLILWVYYRVYFMSCLINALYQGYRRCNIWLTECQPALEEHTPLDFYILYGSLFVLWLLQIVWALFILKLYCRKCTSY